MKMQKKPFSDVYTLSLLAPNDDFLVLVLVKNEYLVKIDGRVGS